MTTQRRTPRSERGVTLLEALVSLTILLVGIVGMMQMQIVGITADAGARAQTQAYQLARELASALERLDVGNGLLDPTATTATPPAGFGSVLLPDGTAATSGVTPWSDATHGAALTGVTTDAQLLAAFGPDPADATLPRFQRRWSVWESGDGSGVKLIVVSVTYREKSLPGLREARLLTQVSSPDLASAFAGALR